jgi:hypothetical protein
VSPYISLLLDRFYEFKRNINAEIFWINPISWWVAEESPLRTTI